MSLIKDAQAILGNNKVITFESMVASFSQKLSCADVVLYSEAALLRCSDENQQGHDWRLVGGLALSLLDQQRIRCPTMKRPCFYNNFWLYDTMHADCMQSLPEPGYVLIDFEPRFNGLDRGAQDNKLLLLGDSFYRADEGIVTQAIIAAADAGDWLLFRKYHWSSRLDGFGCNFGVGTFFDYSVVVTEVLQQTVRDGLVGTCVSLRYDV